MGGGGWESSGDALRAVSVRFIVRRVKTKLGTSIMIRCFRVWELEARHPFWARMRSACIGEILAKERVQIKSAGPRRPGPPPAQHSWELSDVFLHEHHLPQRC